MEHFNENEQQQEEKGYGEIEMNPEKNCNQQSQVGEQTEIEAALKQPSD